MRDLCYISIDIKEIAAGSSGSSYAPVMELVDMRDLGSRARACGFESLQAHQRENPVDFCRWDFCLVLFIFHYSVFIIHSAGFSMNNEVASLMNDE